MNMFFLFQHSTSTPAPFSHLTKFLCIFVISIIVFVSYSSSAYAADYYVDGSVESSGDGSEGSPFKTIQEGADVAVAGDTVHVKGGMTYSGGTDCSVMGSERAVVCIQNSGSEGNYITFQSWPGYGIPIIDLNGEAGNGFGISGMNKGYFIIDGFKLTGTGSFGNPALIYIPFFNCQVSQHCER